MTMDRLITAAKQKLKSMLADSVVQVEPTRRCNFHCRHCTHRDNDGYLDLDVYRKILQRHTGCDVVKLQGLGEPLLHPRIQQLVDMAKEGGHRVMIITNGSLPHIRNVDHYVFSLETMTPAVFESIGKRDLPRVLANVRQAASLQRVTINCVQCSNNTPSDVAQVKAFAAELGADLWVTPQEVWVDPSHADHAAQVEDTRAAWRTHGIDPGYRKYRVCNWGVSEFYYDCTGTSHPCCIRMTDDYQGAAPCPKICRSCPL